MANLESAVEVARVQTAWGATLYFDNFLKEKTKLVRGRRVPQRNGSGILRVMGHQTCGGGEGALISDFAEFLISCKKLRNFLSIEEKLPWVGGQPKMRQCPRSATVITHVCLSVVSPHLLSRLARSDHQMLSSPTSSPVCETNRDKNNK